MAQGYKTGGRTKGTRNKRTQHTVQALRDYIDEQSTPAKSCDPFLRAVDLLRDSEDPDVILKCITFLGDRLLPKLAAVKVSGDVETPVQVVYQVSLGQDPMLPANGHHHGPGTTPHPERMDAPWPEA